MDHGSGLEAGQHGDDLLDSSSWQRPWSKGFNALCLTNVTASHENAKIIYCLDAGSLGKENKILDAKKSLFVMPEPDSLPGHVLALSLGLCQLIAYSSLWMLPKQTIFFGNVF